MSDAVLALRGISKRFGATQALSDVTLELPAGSVQAIVGHNGAGKSTLMRVLNGEVEPDNGEVSIDGSVVTLDSPATAARHGIAVVHQEMLLCPHLTVLENMFVGREHGHAGVLDWKAMARQAQDLLEVLNLAHLRDVRTGALDVAHQQLTGIARALLMEPRILILDEPNSALTERESDELFARVRTLRDRGHLVIYISHRLREVRDIADSIVVMREGRVVERVAPGTPVEALARMLIGDAPAADRPTMAENGRSRPQASSATALAVRGWTDRRRAFRAVDLTVRAGEVVGISGAEGSGHRELLRSLGGLRRASGSITVGEEPLRRHDVGSLLGRGVAYLSPDRGSKSLFQTLSIERNIGVGVLDEWSTWGVQRRRRLREIAGEQIGRYHIKGAADQPVRALSGGNQQKVALARLIVTKPRAVLLEEPTRGVDLGAKAEIYAVLRQLRSAGTAIVVTSPELDELVDLCDRVLVLRGGMVATELHGEALDETGLLSAAAG